MSVHKKLMEARLKLQGMKLEKSGHNKFAGYNYFELGDFLLPTQQIFSALGLCGIVSYTADTAKLTITDTEDNSFLEITSPMGSAALKGCHEVQNIGAVETYQRRYLWVTALEIVEHDALDATTGKTEPEKKEVAPKKQAKLISPALKTQNYEVSEGRADEIFKAAQQAVSQHIAGDDKAAYDEISGIDDNDEKQYLWAVITEFSALRAAIKRLAAEDRVAA